MGLLMSSAIRAAFVYPGFSRIPAFRETQLSLPSVAILRCHSQFRLQVFE